MVSIEQLRLLAALGTEPAKSMATELLARREAESALRESLIFANELLANFNLAVCDKHAVSWKLDAFTSCTECAQPPAEEGKETR